MARKYIWNNDKYRDVVRDLRPFVKGFDSSDGFKLSETLTKSQKAKARKWFHRIAVLQAQPTRPVFARGDNLRKLQEGFHGGVPSKELKVAFIPDTEPKFTLPGAKKRPPKMRVLKDGISIRRANYERILVPFNHKRLAVDAAAEIARAHESMIVRDKRGKIITEPKLFFVQTEMYQTINGKSIGLVTSQILQWMHQYDGKRALPAGSGNKGDSPKHHHWSQWLTGLVGYKLYNDISPVEMSKIIRKGRVANEELKASRNRKMQRKGRKGRK